MWRVWVRRGGVYGLGGETGGKETTGGDLDVDGYIIIGWIEKNEMG